MRRLATLFVATVLLAGCAGAARTLEITGETLDATGRQFVAVAAQVTPACESKVLSADLCNRFIKFGKEFQRNFPHVVALWHAARGANDTAMTEAASDVVTKLATDLSKLAVDVVRSFTPKSEGK